MPTKTRNVKMPQKGNIISINDIRAKRDAAADFSKSCGDIMAPQEPPYIRYMIYGVVNTDGDGFITDHDVEEVAAFSNFEEAKAYVAARDVWAKKIYPAYVIQDTEGDTTVLLTGLPGGAWTEQQISEL